MTSLLSWAWSVRYAVDTCIDRGSTRSSHRATLKAWRKCRVLFIVHRVPSTGLQGSIFQLATTHMYIEKRCKVSHFTEGAWGQGVLGGRRSAVGDCTGIRAASRSFPAFLLVRWSGGVDGVGFYNLHDTLPQGNQMRILLYILVDTCCFH